MPLILDNSVLNDDVDGIVSWGMWGIIASHGMIVIESALAFTPSISHRNVRTIVLLFYAHNVGKILGMYRKMGNLNRIHSTD